MFEAKNNHFRVTFPNGYTVSVAFGPYNYCDNKVELFEYFPKEYIPCENAEVAVLDPDRNLVFWWGEDDNNVRGWQTPEQVLMLFNEVAALAKRGEE